MIRMYIAFFIAFAICYFGIDAYRKLTGKDKWALTKLLGYSILCSVLAVSILSAIVILF
jgi:hypothetical protein